jgi:hypothetical protein
VFLDGFQGVFGAGGHEAASWRFERRKKAAVKADGRQQHTFHHYHLLSKDFRSGTKLQKGCHSCGQLFLYQGLAADEQQINAVYKPVLIEPVSFAQQAFYPIAHDRYPQALAGGEAYSACTAAPGKDVKHQMPIGKGFSQPVDSLKAFVFTQNAALWQFVHQINPVKGLRKRLGMRQVF